MSAAAFPETRWSLVLSLRTGDETARQQSLTHLCQVYWMPLYAMARSLGQSAHDAEDLTQGFLARLLQQRNLDHLEPGNGRMRTYLRAAFRHHVINSIRHEQRQKRGGEYETLSLDFTTAEALADPATPPDVVFDREWAHTVLTRSLRQLQETYRTRGKEVLFKTLQPCLSEGAETALSEVASSLGLTEGAVRTSLYRLRKEFGGIIRTEIADTLGPSEDIEEELQHLIRCAS